MLVFWMPYLQLRVVYSLPFIHDITTDTENPPPFVELLQARMASPNGADYEGQELADQQHAAYPDIGPLYFDRPVESVFAQAVSARKSSSQDAFSGSSTWPASMTALWRRWCMNRTRNRINHPDHGHLHAPWATMSA